MHWLKEHGITTNWWEYDNLPDSVKGDARMWMRAESEDFKSRQNEAKATTRSTTRRGKR